LFIASSPYVPEAEAGVERLCNRIFWHVVVVVVGIDILFTPGSLVLYGGVRDVLDTNFSLSHMVACQLGWISTPPSTRVQNLALHQEGISVENNIVSGADAVMN